MIESKTKARYVNEMKPNKKLEKDILLVGLGTVFGLISGMVGNYLDREFTKYGFAYDFFVGVLFLAIIGCIYFFLRYVK